MGPQKRYHGFHIDVEARDPSIIHSSYLAVGRYYTGRRGNLAIVLHSEGPTEKTARQNLYQQIDHYIAESHLVAPNDTPTEENH